MQPEKQEDAQAREEHSRTEAQDHWERVVLTELGHTSRLVKDSTQSQHLNSHVRQSVAGAATGTLCEAEWAQECAFHPGQAVVGGHGYLHEVVSEAREERNYMRTGSVAGGHPGLVEVRRPQSAIRAAAGRSRHTFDPRRCGGTAAQAGSLASAFGSAGAVGALDLQRIGART